MSRPRAAASRRRPAAPRPLPLEQRPSGRAARSWSCGRANVAATRTGPVVADAPDGAACATARPPSHLRGRRSRRDLGDHFAGELVRQLPDRADRCIPRDHRRLDGPHGSQRTALPRPRSADGHRRLCRGPPDAPHHISRLPRSCSWRPLGPGWRVRSSVSVPRGCGARTSRAPRWRSPSGFRRSHTDGQERWAAAPGSRSTNRCRHRSWARTSTLRSGSPGSQDCAAVITLVILANLVRSRYRPIVPLDT